MKRAVRKERAHKASAEVGATTGAEAVALVFGAAIPVGPWGKEILQRLLHFMKQEGPQGLGEGGKGVSHAIEQGCIQNLC